MSEEEDEIHRVFDQRQRAEQRRAGPVIDREIWIRAARSVFAPGDRQPCHVCRKFISIAQAHHLVPLTAQYDRGFLHPDHASVWLCPNHHVMAHLIIQDDDRSLLPPAMRARDRTVAALHEDLTEDEFRKLLGLMRRAGGLSE